MEVLPTSCLPFAMPVAGRVLALTRLTGGKTCSVGNGLQCRASGAQPTSIRTYKTTIRKPMGLVLAEDKANKRIFVEEVLVGSNAAKAGKVQVGDVLSKCSATILKAGKENQYEREGYGQRPYDNWETIMFDCKGQDFDTVMAAIGSNNERWGIFDVTLEMERPSS